MEDIITNSSNYSTKWEKGLLEYGDHVIIRKTNPPPFLLKTYMLVDDPSTNDVVSWNDAGTAFVVWQPAEFARDLLPTFFKHSNFSSFIRQLNTYGFKKVTTRRWEFSNDKFKKGEKEMLGQIQRRKAWSHRHQPPSTVATSQKHPQSHEEHDRRSTSSSSSSELSSLVDENMRLKQENGFLSSELTTMKKKRDELLELVEIYASKEGERECSEEEEEEDEKMPKLFGVRLDVRKEDESMKKKRRVNIYENASRVVVSQSCK